ncbi:MAG: hypothetical protein ACRC1M_04145 [Methanobacteriaceae archaeon]
MRYDDVYSTEELNQKVADYVAFGYKLESRTPKYARLVKNDFSWGTFIVLLFFLIIGALIYWAVKSGNKEEVIIRVKENAKNDDVSYNAVKYCVKCGAGISSEYSKFCPKCRTEVS